MPASGQGLPQAPSMAAMPAQLPGSTPADQQNYLSLMMNMLSAGQMADASGTAAVPIDNGTTIPVVQGGQQASQTSKKKKASAGKSNRGANANQGSQKNGNSQ